MTSKVALQTSKRRKMGFDVDFIDDSGYPMDGVELDSSTSANPAGVSTASATRSIPSPPHSQPIGSNNNNNITTSSMVCDEMQTQRQNETAKLTIGFVSGEASTNDLKQQNQEQETKRSSDSLVNDSAYNEAMTADGPPSLSNIDELIGCFGNSDSPDHGQRNNDLRSSIAAGVNSLFRMGNQASASDHQQNHNNQPNHNAANSTGVIRRFGELFDDDDLE